ncbi:hypothetical protein IIA79_00525 [bacterium]|nr:hypothetical protein [bacterium]
MPLIDCPECDGRVSTSADSCPHCGHPFAQSSSLSARDRKNLEDAGHASRLIADRARAGGWFACVVVIMIIAVAWSTCAM